MAHDPFETVRAIEAALAKARQSGWSDLYIELDWRPYQDLMAIKDIEWEPSVSVSTIGAAHDDRPIKQYRGTPLFLKVTTSSVLTRLPTGEIQGWAIVTKGAVQ